MADKPLMTATSEVADAATEESGGVKGFVEDLRAMAALVDAAQGQAAVQMLSGALFADAADMIEKQAAIVAELSRVLAAYPPNMLPYTATLDEAVDARGNALGRSDRGGVVIAASRPEPTDHSPV